MYADVQWVISVIQECIHMHTYVYTCIPLNTCVYISVQMYNQIKCTRCTLCICIHMHTLMHRCIFTYVVRSKFLWQQELKLFFSTSTACTRCCSTSLFFAAGSVSSCARKPLTAATFSRWFGRELHGGVKEEPHRCWECESGRILQQVSYTCWMDPPLDGEKKEQPIHSEGIHPCRIASTGWYPVSLGCKGGEQTWSLRDHLRHVLWGCPLS